MEDKKLKPKKIVAAICIVFLVAMSALASAGEESENLTDGITDDLSSTENGTIIGQGWGTPNLDITDKNVEPNVIAPGGTGVLNLTISEVSGSDWAEDTTIYVEILDPDGCVFLETGSSQAEKHLGNIDEDGSKDASFYLRAADAPVGEKTINITVKYWETGWLDVGVFGPLYEHASINFNVNNPTVSISTGNYTVYRNEPFTVNIAVNQTVPIAGVELDLRFDPSLVSVNSITKGDLLGPNTGFSLGTKDNVVGTITNMAGWITEPGQNVSTPGVFATIQMTAKNVTGTSPLFSPLDLSNVEIYDIDAIRKPTLVKAGSVTVLPYDDCDVNRDSYCKVDDIILVVQCFEKTGAPHWIREDTNRDGKVDVLDIIVIRQHWRG